MSEPLEIYISSESPIKHRAATRAFGRVGLQLEVVSFAVESDIVAQPKTIQETYEGAKNRHAKLQQLIGNKAGYLVTSESGVVKPFPGAPWKGCEIVIIEKIPEGSSIIGMDLGVEYPQEWMDKVPSIYPDLGVLMQQEYGFSEKDPPLYLTHGKVARADLIEQAMFKALAQMDI
jgi:non-canonical (house-cleaning) NTP pyrophosphatase